MGRGITRPCRGAGHERSDIGLVTPITWRLPDGRTRGITRLRASEAPHRPIAPIAVHREKAPLAPRPSLRARRKAEGFRRNRPRSSAGRGREK